MEKDEMTSKIVRRIDTKMNSARESTGYILEHLVELRTNINEAQFLQGFLDAAIGDDEVS